MILLRRPFSGRQEGRRPAAITTGGAAEARSPRDSRFRVVPASDLRTAPVEWFWPGRIAFRTMTLLAGAPGLGKSLLALDLAARLSRGELDSPEPGVTLLLTAEDSFTQTVKPRLLAAEADLERVRFVEGTDRGMLFPDDCRKLEQLVRENEARLVVIDPLTAHLPASVNSWHDQSVRGALAPLYQLGERTGAAILMVVHLNKRQEGDGLQRIGGSVGIPAAARNALLLARSPDDPEGTHGSMRVLAQMKANLGPVSPSLLYEVTPVPLENGVEAARLVQVGECSYRPAELLSTVSDVSASALDEAKEFLRVELTSGPRSVAQIKAASDGLGLARETVKRAKQALGVKSVKAGFEGGWMWQLPQTDEGRPA